MRLFTKDDMLGDSPALWFTTGLPDCGIGSVFGEEFEPLVKGDTLFLDNEKIGTIATDAIHILKYRRDGVKESIDIVRQNDGSLNYHHFINSPADHLQYWIESTLTPHPDGKPYEDCY
jgi:hypothetical protein